MAGGFRRDRVHRGLAAAAGVLAAYAAYRAFLLPSLGIPYPKRLIWSLSNVASAYLLGARALVEPWLPGTLSELLRCSAACAPLCMAVAAALPWAAARAEPAAAEKRPGRNSDPARGQGIASRRPGRRLLVAGFAIFLLGYVPIAVSEYDPIAFGLGNRVNLIGALGAAAALTGLGALAASVWARRGLALLAGAALAAHVGIAGDWAAAYEEQLRVRDLLRSKAESWPAGKTLLLLPERYYVDRMGPIFLAHWDFSGAARVWLDDPARVAAVITPKSRFTPAGVQVSPENAPEPYEKFLLLDARRGVLTRFGFENMRRLP